LEPGDEHLLFHKEKRERLGLLAQLKFYPRYRRFPEQHGDFAPAVVGHLAEQIQRGSGRPPSVATSGVTSADRFPALSGTL
jgi:hypothetical protein